ncbi:hypothetical protein NFI96_001845 [Prochilodus magdalenae]|nr:hypothetical protein NFI96_001845 [Prochilodus magdalenae]
MYIGGVGGESVVICVEMKSQPGNVFTGTEGGNVEIYCTYADGYQNVAKYFCRDPCSSSDVLIESEKADDVDSKSRYALLNNVSALSFTVTISNLSVNDSGIYYCGVERWGRDEYTRVEICVRKVVICVEMKSQPGNVFTGTEGGSVEIYCTYADRYQNVAKYFCRDPCSSSDVLIESEKAVDSKSRYALLNNVSALSFTVTISNLSVNDSGIYYCGVERWGYDKYTRVEICVRKDTSVTTAPLSTLQTVISTHLSSVATPQITTASKLPAQENQISDSAHNQEDISHVYDDMLTVYSLAGPTNPENSSDTYSIIQHDPPAKEDSSVYSLVSPQGKLKMPT